MRVTRMFGAPAVAPPLLHHARTRAQADRAESALPAPDGLYPNAHLLSWCFHPALVPSSTRSVPHARSLRSVVSIPSTTLDAAASAMDASSARRGAASSAPLDFYEASSKRCVLCGTVLSGSYAAHQSYVEHVARVGIVERTVVLLLHHLETTPSNDAGTHRLDRDNVASWTCEDVLAWLDAHWWASLTPSLPGASPTASAGGSDSPLTPFNRVPALSAETQRARMQRLRFLLGTLKDVGVLRYSLMASSGGSAAVFSGATTTQLQRSARDAHTVEEGSYSRNDLFQRFEMIGDNVMKVMMPDRLQAMFPFTEGGVDASLQSIQRLLDSNQGLLDIYDALRLNTLIGANLANSKAKSDVVEAIFGELQAFLWAVETRSESGECLPAVPSRSLQRVRAVTEHALNELMHVLMMWSVDQAVCNAFPLISSHILKPYQRQRATQQRLSAARRAASSSSPPADAVTAEVLLAEAYTQKAISRPASRSPLPLLTKTATPHYLSSTLHTSRDSHLYSACSAPTGVSADQDGARALDTAAQRAPEALRQHYATVPSNQVVLLQWPDAVATPPPPSPSFALAATPHAQPPMSQETVNALEWELVESYPWRTPTAAATSA